MVCVHLSGSVPADRACDDSSLPFPLTGPAFCIVATVNGRSVVAYIMPVALWLFCVAVVKGP